jgi:RNA methyltransferase, TrmH family
MMMMMRSASPTISSTTNPRVRAAVALRERRARDETGLTLVDGAREVRRALEAGVEVVEVFVCEARLAGPDARAAYDRITAGSSVIHSVDERVLERIGFGDRSEGLVAVARIPATALDRLVIGPTPLLVVVEGVEKPGNLGAVLRSADGAGAGAVIAASPVADLFNPNVIRASAGTVFTVPLAAADSVDVLNWLRQQEVPMVATRVDARISYETIDLTGPAALLFGTEAAGLTPIWDADDVRSVRVPMLGIGDSLNVSVTAAVLLYEARRQRDLATRSGRS